MTHVTCRPTAKNRDQLRNPTLGTRVWATFTFFTVTNLAVWVQQTNKVYLLYFVNLPCCDLRGAAGERMEGGSCGAVTPGGAGVAAAACGLTVGDGDTLNVEHELSRWLRELDNSVSRRSGSRFCVLVKGVRRILVRGPVPSCRLRRRKF